MGKTTCGMLTETMESQSVPVGLKTNDGPLEHGFPRRRGAGSRVGAFRNKVKIAVIDGASDRATTPSPYKRTRSFAALDVTERNENECRMVRMPCTAGTVCQGGNGTVENGVGAAGPAARPVALRWPIAAGDENLQQHKASRSRFSNAGSSKVSAQRSGRTISWYVIRIWPPLARKPNVRCCLLPGNAARTHEKIFMLLGSGLRPARAENGGVACVGARTWRGGAKASVPANYGRRRMDYGTRGTGQAAIKQSTPPRLPSERQPIRSGVAALLGGQSGVTKKVWSAGCTGPRTTAGDGNSSVGPMLYADGHPRPRRHTSEIVIDVRTARCSAAAAELVQRDRTTRDPGSGDTRGRAHRRVLGNGTPRATLSKRHEYITATADDGIGLSAFERDRHAGRNSNQMPTRNCSHNCTTIRHFAAKQNVTFEQPDRSEPRGVWWRRTCDGIRLRTRARIGGAQYGT